MSDKVIDIRQGKARVHKNTTQPKARHNKDTQNHAKNAAHDYSLIFVVLFLLGFGLVMLYSASSYEAAINYGDSAYYLKKQGLTSLGGLIVMAAAAILDYRYLRKAAWPLYWLSLIAVIAVKFIGREVNGAKRWIYVGPISVQPAEISKMAVILLTALLICKVSGNQIRTRKGSFMVLWPCLLQGVCIWKFNNNMSTAMIVILIGFGMFFIARRDYLLFCAGGGLGLAAAAGYIYYIVHKADASGLDFRSNRILVWLDPQKYVDGTGYQTLQGLYGIGSGGIFGKGLGESMQKLGYIPEAQNDMIFSVICEELGIVGALSIITLFVILCWRFMIVALNAIDLYGGMVASGVMIHIALQVVLNIAVVTNTIPNTGVTLPFISYGGSSVIILLAEVGLVMSVSRVMRRSAA